VLAVLESAERRGAVVPLRAALAAVAGARDAYDARPIGEGAGELRRVVALARDLRPHENPVHVDNRGGLRLADDGDPAEVTRFGEYCFKLRATSVEDLAAGAFRLVTAPSHGSYQPGATASRFAGLLPEPDVELRDEAAAATRELAPVVPVTLAYQPREGRGANVVNTSAHTGRRIAVGVSGASLEPPTSPSA
jgi:hypothetical protein